MMWCDPTTIAGLMITRPSIHDGWLESSGILEIVGDFWMNDIIDKSTLFLIVWCKDYEFEFGWIGTADWASDLNTKKEENS